MERLFLVSLLSVYIGQSPLVSSASDGYERVTYYVKPSPSSSQCPGQPCETFQYYLKNINTTLNKEKNVTMIFLSGNHTVSLDPCHGQPSCYADAFVISTPIITLIGENEDAILYSEYGYGLSFSDNSKVVFKKLTLSRWPIELQTTKQTEFHMSSATLLNCMIQNTGLMNQRLQIMVENSMSKDGGWWYLVAYSDFVFNNCTFQSMSMFEVVSIGVGARIRDSSFVNTPITIHHSSVIFSGDTVFMDSLYTSESAITVYQGNITLSGSVSFINNSALRGGAMALLSSTLNIDANTIVMFTNNSADQWGGAIYVAPGTISSMALYDNSGLVLPCFYNLLNCNETSTYKFVFEGNSATLGGNDIYGVSLIESNCSVDTHCNLTINGSNSSNSSISSDPLRVCICDTDGKPQCANDSYNKMHHSVHPGERFTLSLVVVGGDFGLTVGAVYANIYQSRDHYYITPPSISPGTGQLVQNISGCTKMDYSLYSRNYNSVVYVFLTTSLIMEQYRTINDGCSDPDELSACLTLPVVIKFSILPCPRGFQLFDHQAPQYDQCDCYPIITSILKITCHITNGTGYFSWTGNRWINVEEDVTYNEYCPHNYCRKGDKTIALPKNSNNQCNCNRAGRLCGKCDKGYSLAIVSSNCILCKTNNNLTLIIFFAAAGFLLVFFIGALNITVTQGTINGLIFYANIVWTYKDIFFTYDGNNIFVTFLKIFIAWLNLDFGIETCLVMGLTALWKTWLQFVFPFYIWIIAGLIIMVTRHSTRLTNLLGNRAVPLLATLFLISYMKLLRIAVSSLEFSILSRINYTHADESTSQLVLWSVDGSLGYFDFPHILLFVAGLITLLFLWMPYTMLLFLMQWLRRLPQRGLLKWVMYFNPLYDAYFAPLKHKHQYWFGALLLARGILLVTFASSFAIPQDINLFLLLILAVFLVYYMVLNRPYKSSGILILQSSYLVNLIILSGFFFFSYRQPNGPVLQSTAITLSTGLAFLQFCVATIYAMIVPLCCKGHKPRPYEEGDEHHNHADRRAAKGDADTLTASGYRDSIFNESEDEPLLPTY